MESILNTLAKIPAPSGRETEICKAMQSLLPNATTYTDPHGTLIVHQKGDGDGTVIVTGMDTPCLYVTYQEGGFARFSAVGGLTVAVGTPVLCENDIFGVIGEDKNGQFIDSGSHTLSIGSWAVPVPSFYKIDADTCGGASLGQYAAMTAVLAAARECHRKEAFFVFGTKSHIRQFSPAFMHRISAQKMISVETSCACDAPAEKTVLVPLGAGTTLRVKDESMLSAPALLDALAATPYRTLREVSTRSGIGGILQKAYGGIVSAGLGIPVRYLGSACEVVSLSDIQNTKDILAYMLS